jgi:chloramphenicol O-acetyltransferase type A
VRTIDLKSWPRKQQFETFREAHFPHFNMCAEVDLSEARRAAEQRGIPVTAAIVYVIARTANDIPEFRYRIRRDEVVEHDIVHPSTTVMVNGGLFSFGLIDYDEDFSVFANHYVEMTARVKEEPTLADPPGRDDLLYLTAIPWVSFTSFSHPVLTIPVDSIPRFAWGRFRRVDSSLKMPLSVQGHHALMDGLHVGRYYEKVHTYLQNPDAFMGDK